MKSATKFAALLATTTSFLLLPNATAQLRGYEIVIEESALTADATKQIKVNCSKKKRAMGSGWAALDATDAILAGVATTDQPAFDGSGWLVNAKNNSSFAKEWKLKVWVTCAYAR